MNKGDIVYRIVGETYIIECLRDITELDYQNPAMVEHRRREVEAQLWHRIREYATDPNALRLELAIKVTPTEEVEEKTSSGRTIMRSVIAKAMIAPLRKEMTT